MSNQLEALKLDVRRAEWMAKVLFSNGWLVTDTGCGCCGDGMLVKEAVDWRAAVDAAIAMKR